MASSQQSTLQNSMAALLSAAQPTPANGNQERQRRRVMPVQMIVNAWQRMVAKLFRFMVAMYQNSVFDEWLQSQRQLATEVVGTPMPKAGRSKNHKATEEGRKRNHVGRPMKKPMNGVFPMAPEVCQHNRSLLQAGGGRGPSYWWHCKGCGNRWERVTAEEAQSIYIGDPEDQWAQSHTPAAIRPSGQIASSNIQDLRVISGSPAQSNPPDAAPFPAASQGFQNFLNVVGGTLLPNLDQQTIMQALLQASQEGISGEGQETPSNMTDAQNNLRNHVQSMMPATAAFQPSSPEGYVVLPTTQPQPTMGQAPNPMIGASMSPVPDPMMGTGQTEPSAAAAAEQVTRTQMETSDLAHKVTGRRRTTGT